MTEEEAAAEISALVKRAKRNGDVALELAQVDGGVEVNWVGADGIGVGYTLPEDIGLALFTFIQKRVDANGGISIDDQSGLKRYDVEKYSYLERPALRIALAA